MLTQQEIDTYRRDGVLVPDYQVPADMLQDMRGALDRLLAANPGRSSDSLLCPHLQSGGAIVVAGVPPVSGDPVWMSFARQSDILDMVAQLIGPDIILWGTTVFGKPAQRGKETPWHQDGQYWPIRPLATCSVWIALDDAGPENGCLRVIPGSHNPGTLRSHHQAPGSRNLTLSLELDEDEFDESQARDIVLKAGQLSMHDIYLLHGSNANRSAQRRAGFVLRLMPATSHFDHELGHDIARQNIGTSDFGNRALFLMRGTDTNGHNNFQIGHGA